MRFTDLAGTLGSFFRLGLTGVRLKNNGGNLAVRNSGDTADAEITAAKANLSGDALQLNSDAANSGADWSYTLQRPATGMATAQTITLPATAGTAGQVLSTDGSGNTSWVSAADTSPCRKCDTTTLGFGDTSPKTLFTLPAYAVVHEVEVVIDTPFTGTPSASIGISGTVSKYRTATQLDLTAAAATSYVVNPSLAASSTAESLIATYAAGSATAGSARVLVTYSVPS